MGLEKINVTSIKSKVEALAEHYSIPEYKCEICKDRKVIVTETNGYQSMRDCECAIQERIKQRIEKSGLGKAFEERTFESYKPHNQSTKEALEACKKYVDESKTENLLLFGNVGTGKSHLAIAVAGELLKKGVPLLYVGYRELVTNLKALAMEHEDRIREIGKYKNPAVLLIDDLYKHSRTEADLGLIYEIVNDRYLSGKRTIITTEYSIKKLAQIDEAIASRLYEGSEEYCVSIKSDNYRFRR